IVILLIKQKTEGEPMEEITEEQFHKDLYVFMKKRNTPIERIPNLGFKQIDLFVMFKTVRDLGGYHQVTSQQLWKQVYNTLGGNPRSTSAATCTRRHYEKLLLPYECHLKGILINIVPQHQPKPFSFPYSKNGDGQRLTKRRLIAIPLSHPYHHYNQRSRTALPPYVPMPPLSVPITQPSNTQAPLCSYLNSTDRVKEPLDHLRDLAEWYKTSSGLAEPLNLSVKAASQVTNSKPASSFAPPSSSKNPKFLNKPSPLYTPHPPQVVRNEGCETQEGEADVGVTEYSYPLKATEPYIVNVAVASNRPSTCECSPTLRTGYDATAFTQKSSSPKTDFTIETKEGREGSPESTPSHFLPSLPQVNGGKMEIEIPLSVFHSWLKQYGSPTMHGSKQLEPTEEESSGQRDCSESDVYPTNMSFHMNSQPQSLVTEDVRLMQRKVPSPTSTIQTTGSDQGSSQKHFTNYKPLPSGAILRNTSSWDVYPVDQQNIFKSHNFKPPSCWDIYDKETKAPHMQVETDSSPLTAQQDFTATKHYNEDATKGGRESSEKGPSAVLMVDSSSTSVFHLTFEEAMKLKKIISSAS
uniref:ARID domain-containing protein n=1 Tax=Monopterus albus TaxID=43700 RepID=A0A3Q3K6I2_MONAL